MRVCLLALPRSWEEEARVASSLSKMDDMQARLRRNLEAIGMLNQQVSNTHARTHLLPPSTSSTPTDADTRPRCGPPAVELAQTETEELSCVLLQKRALAHPFPLPAIKAGGKGVDTVLGWAGLGWVREVEEGGYKLRRETVVTCLSAGK